MQTTNANHVTRNALLVPDLISLSVQVVFRPQEVMLSISMTRRRLLAYFHALLPIMRTVQHEFVSLVLVVHFATLLPQTVKRAEKELLLDCLRELTQLHQPIILNVWLIAMLDPILPVYLGLV